MNITQYHREVKRTTPANQPFRDQLIVGALGLSGEAGEVTDYIKKVAFQGHDLDPAKLVLELGDVLWYLTLLCNLLGISLAEVMVANRDKLRERYRVRFTEAESVNRVEYSDQQPDPADQSAQAAQ